MLAERLGLAQQGLSIGLSFQPPALLIGILPTDHPEKPDSAQARNEIKREKLLPPARAQPEDDAALAAPYLPTGDAFFLEFVLIAPDF